MGSAGDDVTLLRTGARSVRLADTRLDFESRGEKTPRLQAPDELRQLPTIQVIDGLANPIAG